MNGEKILDLLDLYGFWFHQWRYRIQGKILMAKKQARVACFIKYIFISLRIKSGPLMADFPFPHSWPFIHLAPVSSPQTGLPSFCVLNTQEKAWHLACTHYLLGDCQIIIYICQIFNMILSENSWGHSASQTSSKANNLKGKSKVEMFLWFCPPR